MECSHHSQQQSQQQQAVNDRSAAVKGRMADVKHKIIVLSGKGGVGKSTVAVNLAMSLAAQGKRVGLLDVDLHGPTVPQLLGLTGATAEIAGETLQPVEVGSNLRVMSIGFLLGQKEDAVVWRGPMKAIAIEQFLGEVEWGELDYLVVDCPPGTGDEPLAVVQALGDPDGGVIVTTPQETALTNVRRSVKFCELVKVPVLGVVENMAGFVCPNCGEVTHVFSKGGGAAMAAAAGVPFLASIPLDPAIVEAGDSGRPYVEKYPESTAAQEFAKAVIPILALDETNGGGATASPSAADADAVSTSTTALNADEGGAEGAGKETWRFAVPVSNGLLCPHFGHCDEFALVDVDRTSHEILGLSSVPAPEHEPGLLPAWLAERGAEFIIAGGMGSRAQQLFTQQGIDVITGASVMEPDLAVQQFLAGDLATGENACDH